MPHELGVAEQCYLAAMELVYDHAAACAGVFHTSRSFPSQQSRAHESLANHFWSSLRAWSCVLGIWGLWVKSL